MINLIWEAFPLQKAFAREISPPVKKHYTKEGLFILDPEKAHLPFFQRSGDFTVDHVSGEGFELYGPSGTREYVAALNIPFMDLLESPRMAEYAPPEEVEKNLKVLQEKYPHLLKLFSIGRGHGGRELWMVKISANAEKDRVLPEVKYIANMHGDEIVGRELLLLLIKDLITGYEKGDPLITRLVDNTEIFIMPSLNPDGMSLSQRGNGKDVDLNRDFPEIGELLRPGYSWQEPREPETIHMINFQKGRHFSLSANFHGGAVVVNYPWDSISQRHPQDSLAVSLALEYATRVKEMRESTTFPRGITNGYDWYQILGGMQDWSEFFYGDLQLTIELSLSKWPAYSQIPQFYQRNREALLRFLSLVHQGAGFKTSLSQGKVEILNMSPQSHQWISLGKFSFWGGEYYKVLEPGEYEFVITPSGGGDPVYSFKARIPQNLEILPGGRIFSLPPL